VEKVVYLGIMDKIQAVFYTHFLDNIENCLTFASSVWNGNRLCWGATYQG